MMNFKSSQNCFLKEFDAVKRALEIKDKLDSKLSKMTNVEIVRYFKQKRSKTDRIKPSV